MLSSNRPTLMEGLSQVTRGYTGWDLQGEVLVGLGVAIILAYFFLPAARDALETAHTAAFKLGGLFDILALFSISRVNL